MGQSEADSDDAAEAAGTRPAQDTLTPTSPHIMTGDVSTEDASALTMPPGDDAAAMTQQLAEADRFGQVVFGVQQHEDAPDGATQSDDEAAAADAEAGVGSDDLLGGTVPEQSTGSGTGKVVVNVMFDRDIDDNDVALLTKIGFVVQEKFDVFPIITGTIDANSVAAISKIDGVASVEPNREVGPL